MTGYEPEMIEAVYEKCADLSRWIGRYEAYRHGTTPGEIAAALRFPVREVGQILDRFAEEGRLSKFTPPYSQTSRYKPFDILEEISKV